MDRYPFNYDIETSVETLLYLAVKTEKPTFHDIFKLMYFADRYHLEKYGRLICGDRYIAMKHGPVPSAAYDITKAVREDTDIPGFNEYVKQSFRIKNRYFIEPLREPNLLKLSDSEIEALDDSIERFSRLTFNEKTERSHDESYNAADENDVISIEALTLGMDDRESLLKHLNDPNP